MFLTLKLTAVFVLGSVLLTYAQQSAVSGKITDSNGLALPGVTIIVKGNPTLGTVSNVDGTYTLSNVPTNATLQFSFIGMKSQEIAINGRVTVNASLEEDAIGLDEVVAIGYGVQLKSNVTGSITSVRSADMENRVVTDAAQALQGKAAGVQISNTSGAPGSTANIQIRGYSSNARTSPLYIVDGLKVENMNYLDPDNIASIEILKDGASAAIYGIEAGNGVILITTKTGKSTTGQGRIFYNMQHASESLANMPALLNAEQYRKYMLRTNTVKDEADFGYDGHSDTKWVDRVTETGIMARHTVGFEGGNDRGSFFTSLASTNNDGIVIGDKDTYKRLTGQINADYKIKDWLQVGVTTSIEQNETRSVGQGANGILGSAINLDPITPWTYAKGEEPASLLAAVAQGKKVFTDENGLYYGDKYITGGSIHPAVSLLRTDASTKSFNTRGTAYVNLTPIKGLTLTSRFGYRAGYSQNSTYNHEYYVNSYSNGDMSISGRASNNLYYQWENFGNYLFNIGSHDFNVMAGMSYQHSESNFVFASADALTNTDPLFRYLDNALNTTNMDVGGILGENNNMSYYGRVGWNYDRKYNIMASFRADAYDTSKLDKSHRWGYFPSIQGGWTISNESFMDNIKSKLDMSSLMLRVSYGILGNVNALGAYQYASTLDLGLGQGYDFGDGSGQKVGVYPSDQLPNPDVVWETTRQLSGGISARFLNSRLNIDIDVYNKNTYDLITRATAPSQTGASRIYLNAGEVNNRGIELELGWRDEIGDFSYSFNGNIAYLKNEVTKGASSTRLDGAALTNIPDPVTYFEEGYPIWYLRTYVLESIDPDTGRAIYKDFDDNGEINSDDRIMTGKGIPDYTYGLTLNLGYKNFDLTVYGTGVQGIDRLFALNRGDFKHNNTLLEFYEGMWTPGSTNSRFPLFYADDPFFKVSDVMVFDASFFKIKQIQLGYNVPANLLSKVKIQRLRAFVSLEDWFTFTKYPGLDPETSGTNINAIALDQASYPMSKKVVFGINVSL